MLTKPASRTHCSSMGPGEGSRPSLRVASIMRFSQVEISSLGWTLPSSLQVMVMLVTLTVVDIWESARLTSEA